MSDEKNEKKDAAKQYVLTEDQLKALLGAIKANAPTSPYGPGVAVPMSPDDQVNLMRDQIKGDIQKRPPHKIEEIPCTSPETGSVFVAVVSTSDAFPAGRVLAIKDYNYPAGVEVAKLDGGLVPDGLAVKNSKSGELTREFKQWRWVNFYQTDLRRFVGRDAAWLKRMADIGAANAAPVAVSATP